MIDADGFMPLPLAPADEQASAARAEADALLAEANRMHADAQRVLSDAKTSAKWTAQEAREFRARTLGAANGEAEEIRQRAIAETEKKRHRDDKLDTWAARAIIAGAVGLTASGEYELAKMVGFDPMTAWLLPFVIDVYVIQAFRRHRDIVQAIALTVAANVTYHLADAHLFGLTPAARPTWWLIAMVASVASLILWRVHLMQIPAKERRERRSQTQATAEQAPADAQPERVERPVEAPVSATAERAQEPVSERPTERPVERPKKPRTERAQSAQTKPKKSAPKPLAERRQERVLALYTGLGKRPEWTDIRDALAEAKLADKSISRSSCQRIRDAVEAAQPHLAALGSDNVRAITGS
ncbi:hypothetical protein [Streptomyces sp. NBC_00932]|uniref:hypothetical protein n=1 Tax=Streptomyces sp. NBC_00932 TaxID=2903690 RepID=UPI0038682C68|nr:hypothetical protein OG221_27740 [Streptomyces sp. NBC_00932]